MVTIERHSEKPIYMQICAQLRADILSGGIAPGERLPGIRTLAETLGVSRNTVDNAYAQLAAEGYIHAARGVGFVALSLAQEVHAAPVHAQDMQTSICADGAPPRYDLRFGEFSGIQFPTLLWKRYTTQALYDAQRGEAVYADVQGDAVLREALSRHLRRFRGVNCTPAQIIVGCGLHYCLELLAKLLDKPSVAVEDPGFPMARQVFMNNRLDVKALPAAPSGVDLSVLEQMQVGAAYVTPSHQFPFGSAMPAHARTRLLSWAAEHDAFIIEDDYDSEYRYDANPIPALQSLDRVGRVVYIGTFSKSLFPSLRVNFMVLPPRLLSAFHTRFHTYQCPASWLSQQFLAKYLADGGYERHLRRASQAGKKRHDAFTAQAAISFGNRVRLHGIGAGSHFVLEFTGGEHAENMRMRAETAGVRLYTMDSFYMRPQESPGNTLLAGFGRHHADEIRNAVRLLGHTWFPC